MKKEKGWKESLLKSGLPLEHTVTQKLENLGFDLYGEYTYIRTNEDDKNLEFSIDILATKEIKKKNQFWADQIFLIECKYNHPNVKWVFAPHSENANVTIGCIGHIKALSSYQIKNIEKIYNIDKNLPYCIKGIELHDNDQNPQSISRGFHQLNYAALNFVADDLIDSLFYAELPNIFICKILVTTAPLYVMHKNLAIEDFHNAEGIEDISDNHDAVVIYQNTSPQLKELSRNLLRKIEQQVPFIENLQQNLKVDANNQSFQILGSWQSDLNYLTERVIVVSLNAFEKTVQDICGVIQSLEDSIIKLPCVDEESFKKNKVIF